MKVVAISDLHGHLPETPECDLLIIAGDICPVHNHKPLFQKMWLKSVFAHWLKEQPAKHIVGVWGNHDWVGVEEPHPMIPCEFLTDEGCIIACHKHYRVYGLPWQRKFCDWAFNLSEPELNIKYQAIPDGIDIIVSHGPAYGYGDRVGRERVGNMGLLHRIEEIRPKLVVTGHIHCDPGVWTHDGTIIVNATVVNERYQMVYEPRVFEI